MVLSLQTLPGAHFQNHHKYAACQQFGIHFVSICIKFGKYLLQGFTNQCLLESEWLNMMYTGFRLAKVDHPSKAWTECNHVVTMIVIMNMTFKE